MPAEWMDRLRYARSAWSGVGLRLSEGRTTPMILSEPVRNLLDKPLIARISVIDDEGYPHTIPIWFIRDGDEIMFISSRGGRKIRSIQANPKGAVTIGGDPYGSEGYLLKGEF